MNIEHVKHDIRMMRRLKPETFCLLSWQTGYSQDLTHISRSRAALHRCGATACYGGYLALSRAFREAGGTIGEIGQPVLGPYDEGTNAIARWLGVDLDVAERLAKPFFAGATYGKEPYDVTPSDVADALQRLLDTWSVLR